MGGVCGATQKGVTDNLKVHVYYSVTGALIMLQSDVREMRAFEGHIVVFCNDQLIGGADSFQQWAAYNYDFHDDQ